MCRKKALKSELSSPFFFHIAYFVTAEMLGLRASVGVSLKSELPHNLNRFAKFKDFVNNEVVAS